MDFDPHVWNDARMFFLRSALNNCGVECFSGLGPARASASDFKGVRLTCLIMIELFRTLRCLAALGAIVLIGPLAGAKSRPITQTGARIHSRTILVFPGGGLECPSFYCDSRLDRGERVGFNFNFESTGILNNG